MSDIVERLRANMDKYPGFENMNAEAATEIERLRELVAFNEDQRRMLFDAATTLEAERDRWKAEALAWREVNDTAQAVNRLLRVHTHGALVEEAMKTSQAALGIAKAARAANGGAE